MYQVRKNVVLYCSTEPRGMGPAVTRLFVTPNSRLHKEDSALTK